MSSKKASSIVLALAGLLAVCAPAFAHHGTGSSYDSSKTIVLSGVVTKFVWANPHSQLFFDVTDAQGNVVNRGCEMNSPGVLARAGWTKTGLKTGDKITLTMHPSLVGTPVAVFRKIVFPDGASYPGGDVQTAPENNT